MQVKFQEHELAHKLLDGLRGVEIGGAEHNPFGLDTINVAPPFDLQVYEDWNPIAKGDVYAWAHDLPFEDNQWDFVISSHVVEHLPDLISAFIEWNRVTKNEGIIFMIIPRPDAHPEDLLREVTPVEHFFEDYAAKHTVETHSLEGVTMGKMGHYHVHTPLSTIDLITELNRQELINWQLIAWEEVDSKVGNGFTLAFTALK